MPWDVGNKGLIKGSVSTYAALPSPASAYTGQLWYVQTPSGGLLSALNVYKYSKGVYSPNSSNVWELVPINVKLAEDSTTLVNITNWTEFYNYQFDISAGDRVVYNDLLYKNISGSQIATAPNLDTVNWSLDQAENTLIVAKSNGQYSTIKDALDSIPPGNTVKTNIIVHPGVYSENNPLTGKPETTIISSGGQDTVVVEAANANANLLDMVNKFILEDLVLKGVSGSGFSAVCMIQPGFTILERIGFENCSCGVYQNNALSQVYTRNNTFLGTFTDCYKVEAGIAVLADTSVLGFTTTIDKVVNISGANSIMSINGMSAFSPSVNTAIYVDSGASVVAGSVQFQNMTDGVVVQGTDASFKANGIQVFQAQYDAIRVNDVGTNINITIFGADVTGSSNLNFNVLSPNCILSGSGFTEINKGYIHPDSEIYVYILDTSKKGDEGLTILGELNVGSQVRPVESVFGGGDSYTNGMLVYTESSGGVFTDVSIAAADPTGATFSFPGTGIGNSIYIASSLTNGVDYLTHFGIKAKIETAAVLGTGEIICEYWNGSTWVEFNGCTVQGSSPFLKFAKNYFSQTGNSHIKYNPYILDSWVKNDAITPGIGTNYFWIRYNIVSAITTAPVFQQFKLHTNRTEINADGTLEFHADARTYKKLVVDAIKPVEGTMGNAKIYVDENVGVGFENNRFNSVSDLLGVSFELPEDCDTSAPLIFVWKGKFANTGTVGFTIRRKIVKPGDAYTNTEPSASGDTLILTTGSVVIAAGDVREDLRVDVDISEAIPSRSSGFGDEIWITLQYDTRGTAGNFDYTKLSANYLSDFNGRHLRQ